MSPVKKYLNLMEKMLLDRVQGNISQDEESVYIDNLDRIWWGLSEDQMLEVENYIDAHWGGVDG